MYVCVCVIGSAEIMLSAQRQHFMDQALRYMPQHLGVVVAEVRWVPAPLATHACQASSRSAVPWVGP
jgi:hypothetical protein